MTTSNSIDFSETRNEIITNALSLLAVVAAGETVQPADITLCSSLLNQMIKGWMAQGIHLWTEQEGTLFLVNGQSQYILQAGTSGAKASDGSGTPVETYLTVAASASATSITVNNLVGMTSGDYIGIELDNNTIQWTTINGTPSTTVTLTAALTGAASVNNQVFSYTTNCPKPLSIQDARFRNSSGFDRTLKIIPRQEYDRIAQKFNPGDPTVLCYCPQVSTGTVYLWNTPDDVSSRIEFTYLRTIQDFDASTDTPDLPQEWIETIVYNLAVRAAPAYGINLSSGGVTGMPDLLRMAGQFLDEMKAWDCEEPYVTIVPGYRY